MRFRKINKLRTIRAITTCEVTEEQEEDINILEHTQINYAHHTQFLNGGLLLFEEIVKITNF